MTLANVKYAVSPWLVLAGEPGIGKSRLLQEAAGYGASFGWQVLRGGCQRRGGQEPYAPLPGTLGRYAREQEPARLRATLQGCAWLARLLPELADLLEPLPAWAIPPEQERRLVDDAVIRFLGAIAGPAGTLLVLDDLQWASPDALNLLTALAHAAPVVPIRVVGAYRDTDVHPGDPLADTLADLAHAGLVTRLAPAPLADRDAARLFDHLVTDAPPALRARLLARGGRPLLPGELRSSRARGGDQHRRGRHERCRRVGDVPLGRGAERSPARRGPTHGGARVARCGGGDRTTSVTRAARGRDWLFG